MLDESVLDSPEALVRADARGLLRGVAEAGARVRTGARRAAEAGLAELRPEGRPRAVLLAGTGPAAACAADLLGALVGGALPVTLIRPTGPFVSPGALTWTLPGWAGPYDLLLLATPDGSEGGLAALADQAYRRGCSVVAVSPPGAPLAGAIGQSRGLHVPLAPELYAPFAEPGSYEPAESAGTVAGAGQRAGVADSLEIPGVAEPPQPLPAAPGELWALLTPLVMLADRLGLLPGEPGGAPLDALADRLDRVAERCGPAIDVDSNPAKSLAAELADTLPLWWSDGAVAGAVARHAAGTLTALPGRPALAAALPEAMGQHGALLQGSFGGDAGPDDFFRDRVEEPESLHARVVLVRDGGTAEDGASAAGAARDLAHTHGAPLTELAPAEDSGPLETAAELIATADFAAVYLLLAAHDA
ncbi:SIS domain-containing protein [Streptomyces sp. HNM0574]|uniref:SIS domain-containing protein n=1 Tax=Streptomyces sp. HNM0574 TaxID=2714954 RepID=UPI00146EF54B|nr:SIS domain-containing protein [Streptomyces sp. HNM0574]NLU70776.1 mannose-6-phosphate isomerase [Streptomyces sp. HNM0574]